MTAKADNNNSNADIFKEFTGKYSLSKTLRFELIPVGKTAEFIATNKVFQKDKTIDHSYSQAKPYFNKLHQEFINEALEPAKLLDVDFAGFAEVYGKAGDNARKLRQQLAASRRDNQDTDAIQWAIQKNEQTLKEDRTRLYKQIVARLNEEAEEWKREHFDENDKELKKQNMRGVGFLTSASILRILKKRFPKEADADFKEQGLPSLFVDEEENPGQKRYIFDSFDRFAGYLSKFQETRINIYSDKGKATALATRVVGNLELFLANAKVFKEKYQNNFKEIGFVDTSVFELANYKNYLRQSAIEALESDSSYNKVIGTINKQIKEYRDRKASELKRIDRKFQKSQYPLFKKLEKQILGDIEKEGQLIEATPTKSEAVVFFERFKEFIDFNEQRFAAARAFMKAFFADEFADEYSGVYIKNTCVNTISHRWFADGVSFELLLPQVKSSKADDTVRVKKFVTLADIRSAVERLPQLPFKDIYYQRKVVRSDQTQWEQFLSIWRHEFEALFADVIRDDGSITKGYNSYLKQAKTLTEFSDNRKKEQVAKVKDYADAALRVYQLMKYLALDEGDLTEQSGVSVDFYAELDAYAKDFEFIRYYNAFRNFITKKPYDENKIKLNFEKGTLLKGFSQQYNAYLFRKTDDAAGMYLGILKNGESPIDTTATVAQESDYQYFPASQLKFQNLINKAFETTFGYKYSEQADEIRAVRDAQEFIKQRHLKKYPGLEVLTIGTYSSKKELAKAGDAACIDIYSRNTFITLDKAQVEDKHEKGQLYLFRLSVRDWSKFLKHDSLKNIHTYYFEQLSSKHNLESPVFKISGGSEIFLRNATQDLRNNPVHIITGSGKKDITNFLSDRFNESKYRHNRYLSDKYFLHLSIVLNYGAQKPPQGERLAVFSSSYNKEIRTNLATRARNGRVNIIGLDRGEKHLVYYSVINQKGEILDQGSLNKINGQDYYQKLVEREKERLLNRRSWNSVAKIKDLKKGYVSLVVRKIVDLAIEHNAIIVMEDLNDRFKQIRGGIERSVYQQLEKQLIDKLSYLTFKNRKPDELGGVLRGYQLAAPFESFEKMGKQTGIVFYTQAEYTSVTDPLTGFRKNVYISNSASQSKIQQAIEKFDAIGWDDNEQSYFFTYNPVDFVEEKFKKGTHSKVWTVYAKAPRIRREKDEQGYWYHAPINLNDKFRELFTVWGFERYDAEDMRDEIMRKMKDGELSGKRVVDGKDRSFYHSFIYFFNLILQLRNSFSEKWESIEKDDGTVELKKTGEDVDFIASPVKPFFSTGASSKRHGQLSVQNFANFDKRIVGESVDRIRKEFNGDANGAYNIAQKGAIILDRISQKPEKADLFISKLDWDKYTQ